MGKSIKMKLAELEEYKQKQQIVDFVTSKSRLIIASNMVIRENGEDKFKLQVT